MQGVPLYLEMLQVGLQAMTVFGAKYIAVLLLSMCFGYKEHRL